MTKPETKKEARAREILERIEAKKAFIAKRDAEINATPIAKAVAPVKADAIVRAEKDALNYIDRLTARLAENNFDLNVLAPAPKSNIGREEYQTARNKRNLFQSIAADREGNDRDSWYKMDRPHFVEICPARCAKFVEDAKDRAAEHYDAFVYKLVKKIGETETAVLTGNHVWDFSILTVTLPGGEVQKWHTQQIVNCSVYGLLFNQWPTRKLKA